MNNITAILKDAVQWDRGDVSVVYGCIYGDTKFRWPDGIPIRTSKIVEKSEQQEDESFIVKTENSVYKVFYKNPQ